MQPERWWPEAACGEGAWPVSVVVGMIKPRIRSLPAALGTRGSELVALAERLGYTLDGWQKLAANDILATRDDGRLAAFEAALLVSRQCGKSLVGELYSLLWALEGQSVLFTSHRADTCKEIFRRLVATLPEEMGAIPTYTNGKEQLSFPDGGVIMFRTRGPRVGRGFTLDKLVVDEAQIASSEDLDASLPALRTRPDAQILYLGCAPDARQNANCRVLHELRGRAKAGRSDSLCFLEWSAAALDKEGAELQADELTDAVLNDESLWQQATPALESGRITIERMRIEREALDASSFAVEYLSIGIWPIAAAAAGPVTVEAWESLIDPESTLGEDADGVPGLIVGFDMSTERRVSVCVVGRRADGLLHLDFVGRFDGAAGGVRAISEIYSRDDVDVRKIVCDGEPQNLDLLARLRQEYIPESALRTEGASRVGVQASGALVDLVGEEKFRHRGQIELVEALRGAVIKPLSDSWVYSRVRSRSDVSPLLAAAAALWVADVEIAAESRKLNIF